jgi:hypothetical protein
MDQILDDRFDKDKFKNALIENSKLQEDITDIILEIDRKRRETLAQRKKQPASSTPSNSESDESGPDPLLKSPTSLE